MSIHIADTRPTESPTPGKAVRQLGNENTIATALGQEMTDFQRLWLTNFLFDRWTQLHQNLGPWREKMAKWERQSESNYSDRLAEAKLQNGRNANAIFRKQNDSLGLSEGFVDFFTAQARNDIFGTKPWLAATPVGRHDRGLADLISKHSQWKLDQSDLEDSLRDACRVAAWGGTAFIKSRWVREVETFKRLANVSHSIASGKPHTNAAGDVVRAPEDFDLDADGQPAVDGMDVEWRQTLVEENVIVADNSNTCCLDFKDLAFDEKAARLDLAHTDFMVRFRLGLLDVVKAYRIPEDRIWELRGAITGRDETAREHRDENGNNGKTAMFDPDNANPMVTLVEAFVRLDLFENGRPTRIHAIFSPDLNLLFSADYLANVTPGGLLPVFPIRIDKIPSRIFGRGYLEKYEMLNDAIDRKHNAVAIRAEKSAKVWMSLQRDALRDPKQNEVVIDPDVPIELAPDKKLEDFVQFISTPDNNSRVLEIRDQELQMAQMRSGITSAAQGEMKGVPSASTATGTQNIISRGATLLKDPIDQLSKDIRAAVEYNVHLLYANQDRDETFTWGEGEDAELLEIKSGDVQGLRTDVSLTMVAAQNQQKLQLAEKAIQIVMSWVGVPEVEKGPVRPMFIQALSSLEFRDAEDIIRMPVADAAGLLALAPPDIAPVLQQAMLEAGILQPEIGPGGEGVPSAPVVPPAGV